MPALAVSTVSAVPGQPSAAQTPAAVVLASPFATRLAGILDAALASVPGAVGTASSSSQPTVDDAPAGTTPIAGWAWRLPAGAVASAATRKVEAGFCARTIKLVEAKPGGQELPEGATAAAAPSGGNDGTQPVAVKPSSAGAARSANPPDTDQALSGATGSASPTASPATNTPPVMPSATRSLRRAGADSRATPPGADQTATAGGKDAATPPAGVQEEAGKTALAAPAIPAVPSEHDAPSNTASRDDDTPAASRTGEANAILSGAAAADAAPTRATRGGAIGIRQVSSPAAATEPGEASPPTSTAAPVAPASRPSPMSVPNGTDQPSDRAGNPAPAPPTGPSATAPTTAGRADQTVADAAAARARPNATAATSPAPTPDATALAASATPASSDPGAAPASAALAPRAAIATEPAAASPSARAAPSDTPTPAQQAVPALVSLGGGQGIRQVTVRLEPVELGRLQIRLVQPKDGPAQVTVTAERPQTLDLLVRDEARLSRALDQAGVPAEGRSVTFHLAAAAPGTSADPSRNAPSPATPGPQSDGTGASDAGNGSDRGPQRDGYASGQRRLATGSNELEDDTPRAVRWLRTGINITA